MNFLRFLWRNSSFGSREACQTMRMQKSCISNCLVVSRYLRFFSTGSYIAVNRLSTGRLTTLYRRVDIKQWLQVASYSLSKNLHQFHTNESFEEKKEDSLKMTQRNKKSKKFGPHEYEFDAYGYLSVDDLVKFLKHEAAFDICVLQTSGAQRAYVDYFVIVSGVSNRHISAMSKNLEQLFRGQDVRGIGKDGHVSVEGLSSDNWLALDVGNMVVHFFLPETRAIYELEKLWSLGPRYDDQYKALLEEETFLKAVFVGEQKESQDEGN